MAAGDQDRLDPVEYDGELLAVAFDRRSRGCGHPFGDLGLEGCGALQVVLVKGADPGDRPFDLRTVQRIWRSGVCAGEQLPAGLELRGQPEVVERAQVAHPVEPFVEQLAHDPVLEQDLLGPRVEPEVACAAAEVEREILVLVLALLPPGGDRGQRAVHAEVVDRPGDDLGPVLRPEQDHAAFGGHG